MGLFRSSSKSSSKTENISVATQVEDGLGVSINSGGNTDLTIETTDHGAIEAGRSIAEESIDAVRDVSSNALELVDDVTANFSSSLSDLEDSRSEESANNLKTVAELAKVVRTGIDTGGIFLVFLVGIGGVFAYKKWAK